MFLLAGVFLLLKIGPSQPNEADEDEEEEESDGI
jgi:hypothetical protein